jgi:hypothetical protein
MKELRELVRQYVAGEIDYSAFRRAMVVRFQSKRNADPVQNAVNAIGDACADFSESLLPEPNLKEALTRAIAESDPRTTAIALFDPSNFARGNDLIPYVVSDTSPSLYGDYPGNPGLNVKWLAVGQVLFAAPADRESAVVFSSTELLPQ